MADPNEPKKETVRIALPSQPTEPPGASNAPHDTVRINLPVRPPSDPAASAPSTEATKVPTRPTQPPPSPVSAPKPPAPGSEAISPPATSPGLKKETARIAPPPDPRTRPSPGVEMKKTQPLITMPDIVPQSAAVAVAATETKPGAKIDAIPMPLCWTVLGISAVVFIIQIWNYFS